MTIEHCIFPEVRKIQISYKGKKNSFRCSDSNALEEFTWRDFGMPIIGSYKKDSLDKHLSKLVCLILPWDRGWME